MHAFPSGGIGYCGAEVKPGWPKLGAEVTTHFDPATDQHLQTAKRNGTVSFHFHPEPQPWRFHFSPPLLQGKYLSIEGIDNGTSGRLSHGRRIPHGSTFRSGGRGNCRTPARVLQLHAARMSLRADGRNVHWNELDSVWNYDGDYGAHWARLKYDQCTDHVD
jgi:hypothetical protein